MSDDPINEAIEDMFPPHELAARFARKPKLHPITCPRCRGEGTINVKRIRYNPEGWSRRQRISCPTCEGKGTI